MEGYKFVEKSLTKSTFDVTAECRPGYLGKATVAPCSSNGEKYTLSGCEKDPICIAPADATGYDITETNLAKSKFDVTVKCKDGFLGTAAVTACAKDGEPYDVDGCEKDPICLAPTDIAGYSVTETVLAKSKFDVSVECAEGFVGTASVEACSKNGEAYTLAGCEKDPICLGPTDVEGYSVTEVNLAESKFDVNVECATGFAGTASVTACAKHGEAYTLAGCEKDPICLAPTDVEGYSITETVLAVSKFDVTVECALGFTGTASVSPCSENGKPFTLSGCVKDNFCIAPATSAGYEVTEVNLAASKFDVTAECAAGYFGSAKVSTCTTDKGAYALSGCEKDTLCVAPMDSKGYVVDESDLRRSQFDVVAGCADGYSGTAQVTPCSSEGEPYALSGCSKR